MTTAEQVIAVAKAEVGYREGYVNGRWNNDQKYSNETPGLEWSDYQAWCQTFQSWVFMRAGAAELAPRTASCWTAVQWFKARKRFSEYPAVGAQVFFGSGGASHVGLVHSYDEDFVYTVEGNTNTSGSPEGNGVYLRKRARRDPYLYGYGYPDYVGGIKSADPAWQNQNPKPPVVMPPAPHLPQQYAPFPGSAYFRAGRSDSLIARMGQRLVEEGCSAYQVGPSNDWSDADRKSYAKWQYKCGYRGDDADGIPGKSSWDKLKVPATRSDFTYG